MTDHHTPISSIGEFGLIDRIRKIVGPGLSTVPRNALIMGIGDDAAAYRPSPGKIQLMTTDALVEGIHFDLTFTALRHLGWRSMAASFSDIAAMCGVPRYATVTLALPQKITVEMVDDFYTGAVFACREYGCLLVGGDTTACPGNMMVSVSVAGEGTEDRIRYRSGARPGDLLCVTGHLGASLAGLKILQREKSRFEAASGQSAFTPNLEPYAAAMEKHFMPKPRLDISALFEKEVTVSAVIDISDGLASEVHHLCRAGNCGAQIFEHNLPVIATTQKIAAEFGDPTSMYALFSGEEYELLFTMDDKEYEKLEALTGDITIIGRITDNPHQIELIEESGQPRQLHMTGWDHFAPRR
ncbi:MAG TPA: thiamine-phosphate kinase [Bacteroidota bacterium]|nr:thiamine-phosphate kinase [Bacteroidota bacterium]